MNQCVSVPQNAFFRVLFSREARCEWLTDCDTFACAQKKREDEESKTLEHWAQSANNSDEGRNEADTARGVCRGA